MSTPRLAGRPGVVALILLSAAMPMGQAPREAGAQSRGRTASMSVSVTVVRSCLIDTGDVSASSASIGQPSGAGVGVKITCSPNTPSARPQPIDRAAARTVGGTPDWTPIVTSTAARRVVIQF